MSCTPRRHRRARKLTFVSSALCPNAQINITNAIFFWAANQTLQTLGLPTGDTRAKLTIAGPGSEQISCAIYAAIDNTPGVTIQNIQINGARAELGIIYGGLALMIIGGSNVSSAPNFHFYLRADILHTGQSSRQKRQGV